MKVRFVFVAREAALLFKRVLARPWAACWLAALGIGACSNAQTSAPAPAPLTLVEQAAAVMSQERVSRAPAEAARLRFEAARLLEQSYRQSGVQREGQAAIELYQRLLGGPLDCKGRLHSAALSAEQSFNPDLARSAAEAVRDSGCSADAVRLLETLGTGASSTRGEIVAVPFTASADAVPSELVQVTSIERYGSLDSARVVVLLSGPAEFHAGALPPEAKRGPRLYVDVDAAHYEGPESFQVGGVVERVRVGESEAGVRVVLDLRERVYQRVFYLPEPFRLVIDLSKETPRLHPQTGERRVSRVVLDPGHGGHDPGAIGSSGLQEKDVALDVAHRAAPLVARELGIDTLLTRDTDEFVPLDQRVAKANAFGADLFISLHCNASESAESRGVITFVLDASEDEVSEGVAARENSASAAASKHLATLLSQVMDAESVARSTHFAELLQRSAVASLATAYAPTVDGGVRQAGFFVLAGAQMPAVLFEVSFISNPLEEQRLDSAKYRQRLADAVVNAVRAYRDGR